MCRFSAFGYGLYDIGCSGWSSYSVDFSTYLGSAQVGMDMFFDGTFFEYGNGFYSGFVTVDNQFIATDGVNTWEIDDSGDIGYYPYSSSIQHPEPVQQPLTLEELEVHQVGIIITWDVHTTCFKTGYNVWASTNSYSTGGLFGVSGYGYPSEFGFRWISAGNDNSFAFPVHTWTGDGSPHMYGLSSYFTNGYTDNAIQPLATHSRPGYHACVAGADQNTINGINNILQWPIVGMVNLINKY